VKVERVSDLLLDGEDVSRRLVELALVNGAPKAAAACDLAVNRCSRREAVDAVIANLRPLLNVGIPTLVMREWVSKSLGQPGALEHLQIRAETLSELTSDRKGVPVIRLGLLAQLELSQRWSSWKQTDDGCGFEIGEQRGWDMRLTLSLADTISQVPGGTVFHVCERRGAYLPRQPWPRL
jgi:hypothetical protein